MVTQVITEIEKPGVVMVRAVASADKQNDSRPVAGFFVRRRYQGDTFKLNSWKEFSPHWMQWVDQPPPEWLTEIRAKYGDIPELEGEQDSYEEPKLFSMGQASRPVSAEINYANGKIKRGPGRPRLNLE